MEVVTGRNTRAAGKSDLLTGTDHCSVTDTESAKVHINGLEAILMVYRYIVACGRTITCVSDSGSCGINRPSCSGIQVNALVVCGCSCCGSRPVTEGTGYGRIGAGNQPGSTGRCCCIGRRCGGTSCRSSRTGIGGACCRRCCGRSRSGYWPVAGSGRPGLPRGGRRA